MLLFKFLIKFLRHLFFIIILNLEDIISKLLLNMEIFQLIIYLELILGYQIKILQCL
jgi:hypothetical protein